LLLNFIDMTLDPDSQARLFYLSALGLLVLAGVVRAYRGRLSHAAQHVMIWLLIGAGLVIAYGFKDQLRLQLLPGQMVRIDEDSVALTRRDDGHFHIIALVNNKDVEFMIDTGASDIVLNEHDARRIGLDPASLNYTQRAMTANGTVRGAPVTIDSFKFAGVEDRDVHATVNEGDLRVSLLGMRYLSRFSRIAIEGDRMILTR